MKLLKNKRGIELSINFIVMLILAIATFAGGMMFLGKFFTNAQTMRATLDSQTDQQIEKLLDTGSLVVLPITTKEIFRNKFGTFGVGVLADPIASTGNYVVTVTQESAYENNPSKTEITSFKGGTDWSIQPSRTQEKDLKKNEKGKFLIGVTVPSGAKKGTYIFKITVTKNGASYDKPLQMIVKVP